MHEAELDVLPLELAQALGHCFERAADVSLEDQVEGGGLTALDLLEQILELGPAQCRRGRRDMAGHPVPMGPGLADGAGLRQLRGDPELVTCLGRHGEPQHLHRSGGRSLLDLVAAVVDQGLDLAPCRAGDDGVADPKGAAFYDDRSHRAPSDLELRLEHDAARPSLGTGHQLLHLGDQDDLLEEVVDAEVLERRDLHRDRVAAPGLGDQTVLGQLLEHPVGIGLLAVHLVDSHHDRHIGRPGVVDRLDGLRHDAVIGGHHQYHDVSDLGPTRSHGGEGLVTRRVDEGDRMPVPFDLVRADVLGDPTGLAGNDVGRSDAVEQQCLAVVDVAHDGDHRRPGPQIGLVLFLVVLVEELGQQFGLALLAGVDQADLRPELGREQEDHVVGE